MKVGAPSRSRESLDAHILAWMRESSGSGDTPADTTEPGAASRDARFDALARELFAFQFAHCGPYQRFCTARGATPKSVEHWSQIPAVPTGAFKEVALRCFPPGRQRKIFRTSGTATSSRGELHLDTLELYEASLLYALRRFLFPDLHKPSVEATARRMTIRVLAPSPEETPDSSLSHMFGCALQAFGDEESGFDVTGGTLDVAGLAARLAGARAEGRAVALCGTAFAFVHLLEGLKARAFDPAAITMAPGSRVMETGGFKGRARQMPREALHAALEATLGVPRDHIVNQYGMTELGSQFYDSSLRDALDGKASGPRRKLGPAWARVRIVDPKTGREAEPSRPGMLIIHDLANTGSVAAIETADLGYRIPATGDNEEGFEVLGRAPGAEERGCSIAADAMLAEASSEEAPWTR